MNPLDFDFIVLPLGIMVFALVAGIMVILSRHEIANKRKIRRMDAVLKEKNKKREATEKQLNELDTLYTNKSIDKDTLERLQTLVRMNSEKDEETEETLMKIWQE